MLLTCVRKQIGCSSLTRSLCSHKHSVWLWKYTVFVKAGFRPSAAFHKFSLLTGGGMGVLHALGFMKYRTHSTTVLTGKIDHDEITTQSNTSPKGKKYKPHNTPAFGLHLHFHSRLNIFLVWSLSIMLQHISQVYHVLYPDSQLNVNKLPFSYTSYKKNVTQFQA